MTDCELCHEQTAKPQVRAGRLLCEGCTDGWDYQAALTPEERRADERAVELYVDEWSTEGERR